MKQPLWEQLRQELDLYGSDWPPKLALILNAIASQLKTPEDRAFVCTTNDVAKWLEQEARLAIEHQHDQ